jgi:hypothetical protein
MFGRLQRKSNALFKRVPPERGGCREGAKRASAGVQRAGAKLQGGARAVWLR